MIQVLGRQLHHQPRVRTMTVEDGHVVDVDGGSNANAAAGAKYAQGSVPTSGVGRNSLFAPTSDDENANQVRYLLQFHPFHHVLGCVISYQATLQHFRS